MCRSQATAPQPSVAGTRRVPSAMAAGAHPLRRNAHLPPLASMRCVTPSKRRLVQPQLPPGSCMERTRPTVIPAALLVIGRDHDVEPFPRQCRRFRTRSLAREIKQSRRQSIFVPGPSFAARSKAFAGGHDSPRHGVQLSRGDPPSGHGGEQLGRFLIEIAKDAAAGTCRGSSSPSRRPDPRSRWRARPPRSARPPLARPVSALREVGFIRPRAVVVGPRVPTEKPQHRVQRPRIISG